MEIKDCKSCKCESSKVGQLVSCELGSPVRHVCWAAAERDVPAHSGAQREVEGQSGSTQDREGRAQDAPES